METKRKAIPKQTRLAVYDKCSGHCGYCGCELEYKDMQVDHMQPLRVGGVDSIENMMPACRSCNHYKATFNVAGFRIYLSGIYQRLMRDSIPFQVGSRFGIIEHVSDDIVFYFEKAEEK